MVYIINMKIKGYDIVRGIEQHRMFMETPYMKYILRAGEELTMEMKLSIQHYNTLIKIAESRNVLVEKDFTKVSIRSRSSAG